MFSFSGFGSAQTLFEAKNKTSGRRFKTT